MSSRVGLLRSVLEILYKVMEGCDRQQIVVEWHHSRLKGFLSVPCKGVKIFVSFNALERGFS
ncbi:hypothetical protein T4D_652 [Trichinella pseudospiralis]|uniref:Uncharacterized protein n=1 Tax=Trichinella pseudospiralis TaxID=6337 RepID=A0A0V1FRS7_TRIPS|nr:hypothetical protein T4D_652 [Trichinella pseudospiralis]